MGQYNSGMDDVISPPIDAGELPHEPAKWPVVLGWFSIVLGGLGILKNIWMAFSNFTGMSMGGFGQQPEMKEAMSKAMVGMGGLQVALGLMSLVAMCVSVLLLVAGIMLIKRQARGVKLHIGWSLVRMVTAVAELGLVAYSQTVFLKALIEVMPHQANGPSPAAMATIMRASMFGIDGCCGVFALAYPVVVLIVLSKRWAKDEVAHWERPGGAAGPLV